MADTILQHWIFTRFGFPMLLAFFVVFALLDKTEIFGKGKKQLNALVAFVIGLIFVSVRYPVDVVSNLILFLTVALIAVFVGLLLWGFISGKPSVESKWMKIIVGAIVFIGLIVAILWAAGWSATVSDWFFNQDWSGPFWTNLLFIIVIAVAIALVLKNPAKKDS